MAGAWEWVHEIVRSIPPGRVMTYGQISGLMDSRLSALAVGWALNACPDDVPWHRVVNARGTFSTDKKNPGLQARRLRREGVKLQQGRVDLDRYRWSPTGSH